MIVMLKLKFNLIPLLLYFAYLKVGQLVHWFGKSWCKFGYNFASLG